MWIFVRWRPRKCHRMSPGSRWLGTISERQSWRSNCNPKLERSFASAALEPRSNSGTMKHARSWSALRPGFAPAGWTSCRCKPCWMKWLRSHLFSGARGGDGAGKSVSPFEVGRRLAEVSRVPVYGLSRSELEEGIIGGALLDFSEMGQKTAALAFRVLAGERPPALSPPDPATNPLFINWHALKKWHVSASQIPGAATVRDRGPGLWERHRRLILTTTSVVGLQSVLIVWLT